ncbi:MAG: nitrite/sulfite reductase, partial [Romboutsia sp.]|nr:nitrite/sulfite reductase [Romboutsia sp.]
ENGSEKVLNAIPRVQISGCLNSCGVHQIGSIGLAGKKKKIDGVLEDVFELFIDGEFHVGKTRLATSLGDYKAVDLPKLLFEIASAVSSSNKEFYTGVKENKEELDSIISNYKIN